jgi:hypothetical protein
MPKWYGLQGLIIIIIIAVAALQQPTTTATHQALNKKPHPTHVLQNNQLLGAVNVYS